MKFKIKYPNKRQFINKLLLTCILIVSILFSAGCIGEEKTDTETPASQQITQKSDTQTTDLILKPSDVPGLTLDPDYRFWAVPKNTLFIYDNTVDRQGYRDTLPIGYRNVGERFTWRDQSGREVEIILTRYDSDPNSKLIELFTDLEDNFEEGFLAGRKQQPNIDYEWGDPRIGDYSWHYTSTDQSTGIQTTIIWLLHSDNYMMIVVTDEEGKKEAIRIAKIIKSRLD